MSIWERLRRTENRVPAEVNAGGLRGTNGRLTKRALIVAAAGAGIVALLLAAWQVAQILLLIFASILLAIFLRTIASYITQHTALSMAWSLAATVLALLSITLLIGALYGPDIADGFYWLGRRLPAVLDRLRNRLDQYAWGPAFLNTLANAGSDFVDPTQLGKIAGIFSTALGALGSLLIVLVLGIYFAVEPGTYVDGVARLFPPEHRERVRESFAHLGHGLRWWLIGRIGAMLAVGVLSFIGLLLLDVPFAFVLALLNALLDFIPNVGPLIAAVPALLVALSQEPATAFYVALLYLGIQLLEGFLIMPVIQQRTTSLPPALLLAAQLVMGVGFGILGFLLASPLAVIVMILVRTLYLRDVLGERVKLP